MEFVSVGVISGLRGVYVDLVGRQISRGITDQLVAIAISTTTDITGNLTDIPILRYTFLFFTPFGGLGP